MKFISWNMTEHMRGEGLPEPNERHPQGAGKVKYEC